MLALKPPPRFCPKLQRPPRRKRVTIAAGYLCKGGVILSADTQETIQGYVKTSTDKITVFEGSTYTVGFAGSGNNAVQIDMVIQEICDELEAEEPPTMIGFKALLHIVLDRLLPQPYYPKDSPDVELLIAIREGGHSHLFVTHDNVFAQMKEFECIGAGVVTGRSMFQRYYRRDHTLIESYIVAAYVLHHAKRWVDGCGGKSDIFLLPNDSKTVTRLPSSEIESLEAYFDDLDTALRPLLTACPTEPANDARFKSELTTTNQNLWAARARFQEFEQVFKRLMNEAGMDGEKMWVATVESVDQLLKQPSPFPVPSQADSAQSSKP
jgi:20S proteasome alpha/beta subunit